MSTSHGVKCTFKAWSTCWTTAVLPLAEWPNKYTADGRGFCSSIRINKNKNNKNKNKNKNKDNKNKNKNRNKNKNNDNNNNNKIRMGQASWALPFNEEFNFVKNKHSWSNEIKLTNITAVQLDFQRRINVDKVAKLSFHTVGKATSYVNHSPTCPRRRTNCSIKLWRSGSSLQLSSTETEGNSLLPSGPGKSTHKMVKEKQNKSYNAAQTCC